MDCYLYQSGGRVIGVIEKVRLDDKSLKQTHRYVLLHSDEMKVVLEEFLLKKRHENNLTSTPSDENDWIINEFSDRLQIQDNKGHLINDELSKQKNMGSDDDEGG
ncbi:uncharacterized protein LOC141627295 [Silene latifolia]|uniref:uncharacterized protein LOC141627295 n=1 Tax=Silene latifolia TaxID=37657 RepID=UPI003D785B4C